MTGHKVYVRHSGVKPQDRLQIPLIKHCVRTALMAEGVRAPCEVSVLIVDDKEIKKLNREHRGIDKPTDVLSFPMQALTPGGPKAETGAIDPDTGRLPLGDIVLSAERIDAQARAFGQTREREMAYLIAHSVLHLLGYDHPDGSEGKKKMRGREKAIMREIEGISDDDK